MAKRRPKRTPEEREPYDEITRMLEEALRRRGIPTGEVLASREARTRILEAAIERQARRERS